MGGGFPLDLLLFGMIAAFLVLRLRGILGRRTGYERQTPPERPGAPAAAPNAAPAGRVVDMNGEPLPDSRPLPEPASPTGQVLVKMQSIDNAFDPAHFLRGAEARHSRMIVEAFAKGDPRRAAAATGERDLRQLRKSDLRPGSGRRDTTERAAQHRDGRNRRCRHRWCDSAHYRPLRLGPGCRDRRRGRQTHGWHRCGDRDYRPLDVRALLGPG